MLRGLYQIIKLSNSLNTKNSVDIKEKDSEKFKNKINNPFLIGFIAIFTMELGDKTQVLTVILASSSNNFIATLFGS